MLKKIIQVIVIATVTAFVLAYAIEANAQEPEIKTMYLTCYTAKEGAITATGATVREGICAVSKDKLGYTALIWCEDEFIGYFECLDTGFGGDADGDGIGSIENGTVIDIYRDNLDRCKEMMKLYGGKKLKVQFVKAEG